MRIKIRRAWHVFYDKYLSKRKLRFVQWWDDKYPGKYCWADCVSWAFNPYSFNPFKIADSGACEIESKEHQHKMCYCGGWDNGVCFAKLPTEEQKKITDEREREWKKNRYLPF